MGPSIKQAQTVGSGVEVERDVKADLSSSPDVQELNSREGSISVQSNPQVSWKSYFWDTFDKSPDERKFLFKLDAVLMTLASLGYFIKYLDQVCDQ